MKLLVVKLLTLLLCFSFTASAQNVTGIWRGHFVTEGPSPDQYKFELQIEQNNNNSVSGVSYSYLDSRFYGKATLTGSYSRASKTALVQEIRTIELRMAGGSVACIMKCRLKYTKSGNVELLEGTYTSSYEKSYPLLEIETGGNCGGGKVYLKKVTTSDFYVEPFLREKPIARTKPVQKSPTTSTNKPATNSTVTKPPVQNKPVQKPPVAKTTTPQVQKPSNEQVQKLPSKEEVKTTIKPNLIQIPAVTRSRHNELVRTLTVNNEEIIIKVYDNGEIDDDTISVYMDNKLLLANQRLSASPITFTIKMNEEYSEHVIVMVAENMGRIPPNTSLMLIYDGDKRYEVRITTTEQKNAMIRFRYQKPK
ncbi:MAG: hypothetical protein M3413_08085 [Bacteroidota bacterium]|jgi:hypothetical protein|nr:hypothetical protein [Flavisolibacter sp.]MDQ3551473.1 hypothetical protein [Bacteroidota bacterium]